MKLLKFKDFVKSLSISESRVWAHPERTYRFNDRYASKVPPEIVSSSFNSCKPEEVKRGNSIFFVSVSSEVKSIEYDEFLQMAKKPRFSVLKDTQNENTFLIVGPNTQILTEYKEAKTTTNVKEGLVVLFYFAGISEIPNEHNLSSIISKLRSINLPKESLDKISEKEIEEYLKNLPINKNSAKSLSDYWSIGYFLSTILDNKTHLILRNDLFNEIRKLAKTLTGFPPDKWCPGDIYIVDKSALSEIEKYISEIKNNVQEDSIAKLNDLFSDELNVSNQKGSSIGSIVAISLKQEAAQAGKAKEFLKSLTKDQTEYNVTDNEYEEDDSSIIKKIEELRRKIASSCSKSSITVDLQQETDYDNPDPIKMRSKYASLKVVSKLLESPDDVDNNILKSAAFAMSLTGVNPTFFKLSGSTKGPAKSDKFPRGEIIYLLDHGLGDPRSVVKIIDRNSNQEVIFSFRIKKGEEEKTVYMKARPNGAKQATLEIEKLK